MREKTIKRKFDPLTIIASVAADFDVATDWAFYDNISGRAGVQPCLESDPDCDYSDNYYSGIEAVRITALTFSIIGTVLWFFVLTEFHLISSIATRVDDFLDDLIAVGERPTRTYNSVLRKLKRISVGLILLINILFEDFPQLIIASIDTAGNPKGLNIYGAFTIAGSVFSVIARLLEVRASWQEVSARAELQLVDVAGDVMQEMFDKDGAARTARLNVVWSADFTDYQMRGLNARQRTEALQFLRALPEPEERSRAEQQRDLLAGNLDLRHSLPIDLLTCEWLRNLSNLTTLDLRGREELTQLDLSGSSNLERIRLDDCIALTTLNLSG
jgi:hypothetical protein